MIALALCALGFAQTTALETRDPEEREVAAAWTEFVEQRRAGEPTTLPDYSYAGPALVPWSPPRVSKVFDVTAFGAVANDGRSDREALASAVSAAEANGGGIVLFPPGRFQLAAEADLADGLRIRGENIVLRGAGSGVGGTEIYMRHALRPRDPNQPWSTPSLLQFRASGSVGPAACRVVASATRETFEIVVDDPGAFRAGDFVELRMRDPKALSSLLAGLEPWDVWSATLESGIDVRERHRIEAILDDTIRFAEPLHIDVDAAHGWSLHKSPQAMGWGVEDIAFRGEAPAPFRHHEDAAHDSGWSILEFSRGLGPYVRRCRFSDVSWAVSFRGCYGGTAIHCSLEGRRGHGAIQSVAHSYGTLIAFCADATSGGAFHGFGVSHGAVGTVIYRCKSSDRGLDWHASGPYATLIDATRGGLIGNGGNYKVLPNHLQHLTFWNFEQTSGATYTALDWWAPRRGQELYGTPKVVRPTIVGFHGSETRFLESSCAYVESIGEPTQPESLFEAQLGLRWPDPPDWLVEGRRLYDEYANTGEWKKR